MKKLYSFWLTALVVLFASFQANAALTTTIKWNTPGSVEIYVGGTGAGNKVSLPADATEYVAVIDNTWGATYVGPATGYKLTSCIAAGNSLNPIGNGMYRIDMETYNGKEAIITAEEIVYDKTFSVNVINGREALYCELWGTNRTIKLKTGQQTIAYSSKYETGVDIQAPVAGSENSYIKQDGIEMEWKAYYGWDTSLYHKYNGTSQKGFGFDQGTNFEIKYCETPDEAEAASAFITVNYEGDGANAINMIFNVTQMHTISERQNIEVAQGDKVRFVFNVADYVVKVNGTDVGYSYDGIIPFEFTVSTNTTISISATEREYANTSVTFAATSLEGLVLRAGYYNGPIMDHSQVTQIGSTTYSYKDINENTKSASLNLYSATVSLKSPKLFISEAPEYWFEVCEYKDGSDVIPAGIATPEYTLYVVNKPIVRNTKLVIYTSTDNINVTPSALVVRDRNRNSFKIANGYTEVMIDPEYSSPISVLGMDIAEGTPFSVFVNMAGVSKDEESGAFACDITEPSVIHIFAGRSAAAECNISAYITPDAQGATITLDRVRTLTTANSPVTAFRGTEITVAPAANQYILDGVDQAIEEGSHTFAVTTHHDIVIGDAAKVSVTPADGEEVEEFTRFVITLPNAATAIVDNSKVQEIELTNASGTYASGEINLTQIAGAKVPTFTIVPEELPTLPGTYTLTIPAGTFKAQGSVDCAEIATSFKIAGEIAATGDVDGDGKVDINDLGALVNIVCGLGAETAGSDVDADGKVDVNDLGALVNIVCGF